MLAEELCESIVAVSESIKEVKREVHDEIEHEKNSTKKESKVLNKLSKACEALELLVVDDEHGANA